MSENLIAKASTSIHSSKDRVWDALVEPEAIKHYMFGADVESEWREGSPITWTGEMKGRRYQDKGMILRLQPERTLRYSHFSPQSGQADRAENYHIVTIHLSGEGDQTEVTLSQDNNPDEKARKESEKNWRTMLDGLKHALTVRSFFCASAKAALRTGSSAAMPWPEVRLNNPVRCTGSFSSCAAGTSAVGSS